MAESINAAINRHVRLRDQHAAKVEELLKQVIWCPGCKKYHEKSAFSLTSKERTEHGAIIHADAGYGDDDELGDVTYEEIWWVCPKGHQAALKNQFTKSVTNRHYRGQRLVTRWE